LLLLLPQAGARRRRRAGARLLLLLLLHQRGYRIAGDAGGRGCHAHRQAAGRRHQQALRVWLGWPTASSVLRAQGTTA
jgi:hypothetical protein